GSSGSHLIYPKDPQGFAILVDLNATQPILADRIYLIALIAVADWAHEGWKHIWPSRVPKQTLELYGVALSFRSIALPRQKHQLRTSYLILGLLHLIDQMTKRKEGFCASTVSTLMEKVPTGFIRLALPTTPGLGQSWFMSEGNSTGKNDGSWRKPAALGNSLTNTKRVIDPKDEDFAIVYEIKGTRMLCVDLLSAALYAMATAAQGDNGEFCQDLAGFNQQSTVVYRVNGKQPTESMHLLSYGQVRRGLVLLIPKMYGEGTCGEVKFTFEYGGDILGAGSFELSGLARVAAQ
ncbi:MAG: hypothetical protein Q9184_007800, partial [Pyrenodesmia sp. 2 TL-2023]